MPVALQMPKLGLTMQEGTVVEWRCREGQRVHRGEILLLIESEKVEFEVEAPSEGVVRAVVIPEATTVPCGEILAVLTETEEEPLDVDAFLAEHREAARAAAPTSPSVASKPRAKGSRRAGESPRASPRARKLADQEGVTLAGLEGSGPGGRITEKDVEAAIETLGPRITVDDARLGYAEIPGPEPTLVFLPGLGLDRIAFNPQLAELSGWRRLVAVDPRGCGASTDPGNEPLAITRLAEDVHALLDALEIEQADLVGSSLGAAVAVETARRLPDRVRRLVLISPPADPDARLLSAINSFGAVAATGNAEARVLAMAPWFFGRSFLSDQPRADRVLRALAGAAARIPARTIARQSDALRRWLEEAGDRYASVRVPTMIVIGADDALTPPVHADTVARDVPNAHREELEDVGHAPMVEAPERLHALLRKFLDS
jgi:pyruvate dehydrogenase E2 component (dihydrolipoamide acetyltransferase)